MLAPPTSKQATPARLGNRYQLLDSLGSGGMGAVYRAYDQLTGETTALKRLPQVPLRPVPAELRLALAHEFQALAALRHPGVVTVRDYGFDDKGQPFFTMELLPFARNFVAAGENLYQDGRIDLLLQLLTTLTYIHRCDVIHRDLKPENVLVTEKGEVKVLDFGLAGFLGEDMPTAGTLPYMAPELLQGQPANVRSDLYAVGVIAYELFAGWHPFVHTRNMAQAIINESPDFSLLNLPIDLEQVFQRLLAKDPLNRYRDAAAAVAALCNALNRPLPEETSAARESFLQAAPFIGRTKELYQLEAARRQALKGQGSGLLISGKSGIGKSRLLQELRIRALVDGMLVLPGQGQTNGPAYHLWLDVLRPLLLHTPVNDLDAAVLQAIVPDAPRLLDRPVGEAPSLPAQDAQKRLNLTVLELLRRAAAATPLLLLLDDLHWADENSLILLQNISRHLTGLAIIVIGSFRPGERPQLAEQLPGLALIDLAPLSAGKVADLSAAILGENGRQPQLLHFLERETEGNTFFIVEVVRALAEEAGRLDKITAVSLPDKIFPSGIQEILKRRLDRIPDSLQPLLRTAAIAGRRLDLDLIAHLFPQTDLEHWLTITANAGVLEQPLGAPTWQFSHDKLRQFILDQTSQSDQQRNHSHIALALETMYGSDLSTHYGSLAYHFGRSGAVDQERHYLRLAAHHAEKTYANEAAVEYYQQLLTLIPAGEEQANIFLSLGAVCRISGRWDESQQYLEKAAGLPDVTAKDQAQAFRLLGRLERRRQQYESAVTWLEQALQAYQHLNDLSGICQTEVEIANIFFQQSSFEEARRHLALAMTAAKAGEDESDLALVQHNFGSVAYSQGDFETAAARSKEALIIRQRLDNPQELADSYNNLGLVAYRQGQWQTAMTHFEQSLALRRKVGDRWGTAASLSNLGMVPYQQRAYDTAQRYWQEAIQMRRLMGDTIGMAGLLDNLALIAAAQEQYGEARELMEEAILNRRELGDRQGLAITLSNRGRLALIMTDLPAAENDYRASLEIAAEIGDQIGVIFALSGIAGVQAENGRFEPAAQLLAAAATLLNQIGGAWEIDEKSIFDKAEMLVRANLSPQAFDEAWKTGTMLSQDAAVKLAEKV